MPFNPKSLRNLIPVKPGEIRNPTGKSFAVSTAINKFLSAFPLENERGEKKLTRFENILHKAYKHAMSDDAEFAGRYQELFIRYAIESRDKEMNMRMKTLGLMEGGKYSEDELKARVLLVETGVQDAEFKVVASEPVVEPAPSDEVPDGQDK